MEEEVEQQSTSKGKQSQQKATEGNQTENPGEKVTKGGNVQEEVEVVAESLGAVAISTVQKKGDVNLPIKEVKGRKWVRQKGSKTKKRPSAKALEIELGKRSLVDVIITDGAMEAIRGGEKKKRGDVVMEDCVVSSGTVVLEDQHRREQ
jgi:hypothetical protein